MILPAIIHLVNCVRKRTMVTVPLVPCFYQSHVSVNAVPDPLAYSSSHGAAVCRECRKVGKSCCRQLLCCN